MNDREKSKEELLRELEELRRHVGSFEQSETRWRSMIENSPDYIMTLDPQGTVLFINRTLPELDRAQVIGDSIFNYVDEKFWPVIRAAFDHVLKTGEPARYATDYCDSQGVTTHFRSRVGPVFENGKIVAIAVASTDVTSRKQAEDALRKSEMKYRALVQTIPHGIQECDASGVITYGNSAYHEMNGYPNGQLVGETVWDRMQPGKQREELKQYLEYLVKEQPEPTPYLAVNQAKDGRLFDVQVDWNYKQDDRGQVTGFIAVISDITERRRLERELQEHRDELEALVEDRTSALRESEQRFRTLFDLTPHGILEVDTEGFVVMSNRAHHAMLGYEYGQLIGRNVVQIVSDSEQERIKADLEKFRQEDRTPTPYLFQGVTKDGRLIDCETSWNYRRNEQGQITGFVCVVTDITTRRRVEEALQKSEERFDLAVRGANAGIWDRDMRTGTAYYSPRWKSMLGHDEDEVGDSPTEWESRVHPDDHQRALQTIRQHVEGKSPHYDLIHRLRHKDGSYRWIQSRGMVVRDEEGIPYRMVGSHIDITEQKTAEEELRQERQHLTQLLDMLERDRKLVAYEIHDGFVQPLTAAKMLFEGTECSLGECCPELVTRGFTAANEMLNQSIDDARRLMSFERPLILDEMGLQAAVEHLVCELTARDRVQIDYSSDQSLERLASRLETAVFRIVQEGLTNALRHSNSNSVRVDLTQPNDHIRIEIEDWGVGFDPGQIGEDRFGLEGIRQRARLFGGQATIDSTPGQGTRIYVELPAVKPLVEETG